MFKRLVLLVVVLFILSGTVVYAAEAPEMQWHKGHGTDSGDHVHYGLQTSDGGYIMTGQTSEGRRGFSDMLVVKTDAEGDLQWQKVIGSKGKADYATFVTEASDGFIVAGALDILDNQERALIKFDAKGDIIWKRTYSSEGNGSIRGIDITKDSGIIAVGYIGSGEKGYKFISEDGHGSILKTDANGKLLWSKTLSSTTHGMRVQEAGGGFAIGGNQWIRSEEKAHQDVVLVLTDSDGNEIYHNYYGGDGDDQVFDFAVTTDGGYIFGGHSRSPSYGTVNWDFFLLKVGSDKKEQWHRTFGQPRDYDAKYIHDESYGLQQTPDGGFIIAGGSGDEYPYSESGHPSGSSDEWKAYLVKTDGDGNVQWQGVYPVEGDIGDNAAEYVNLTSDGGYIIFTDSDSAGSMGSNNFGLMKISPDACGGTTPPRPSPTKSGKEPPAQAPEMQWHYGMGTDTGEKPQYVMQTSDGGYLMVGMTDEETGRASDMLIIKADADGDEQWQKIIGTTNQYDWANISAEVADGYIVAGALSDSGDQERCIVKLNKTSGNILSGWPKTYHKDGADAIRGIDETSDGSIVATGYVGGSKPGYLFICDSGNGSIMKTDSNGNLQWDKILPSTMHGMRVQEVPGGFAVGGNQWIHSGGKSQQDVVLVLTDSDGDETYHSYYGGDGDDQVFDFDVTADGGYIFGGHSRSPFYGTVNWDFFLLKVGSDKKEQWHRTFGQPRGYDAKYIHDEAYGVQQTPDGGYIIAGGSGDEYPYSASGHPAGPSDEWKAYLVKTDADGNVQWQGLYPPTSEGNNAAEHINLTSDGGYIVCTDSDSAPGPQPNNFGLMKIAPDAGGEGRLPRQSSMKCGEQAHTQVPEMQWHKGHGTDNGDHVHYGLQSSDGGYIMAGQTSEWKRGSSDMLVVKTDAEGDLRWQKIIGVSGEPDFATFVTEVSGGFIVAGALSVSGDQERGLVKLDSLGKIVWQKTYASVGNGEIRGVAETGDGGFVATGYVGSGRSGYLFISDDGQGSILKTDAEGNLQWEKTLSAASHGMRVYEVAGGYTISGVSRERGRDFCLINTDDSGNIQWHKNYGGNEQEDLFDSDLAEDGGYILAGHKLVFGKISDNTDIFDFWLVKVDSDGNLQWDKTFGQPRGYDAIHIRDECYGVKATFDGGYIMVGGTGDEDSYSASGHPAGPSDIWKSYVVKTDSNGKLLWEGLYGDPAGNNAGEYINLTSDGGYVIFTDSDTAGDMQPNNFGLMKIAPETLGDTTPPKPNTTRLYSQSFYVAPDGNNNNPGTIEEPFATLRKARDAVREFKKQKDEGDITVFIRGGTYIIHKTVVFGLDDSGSKKQRIIYTAYQGETPIFSSARKISGWTKLTNYPDSLPEAARGKIWVADMPETKGGRWRFFCLFDGDKMLPRARGKGWVPEGKPPDEWWRGVFASIEDKSTFRFPEGALKNWENLEDVGIRVFPAGYTMNMLGLASVDEKTRVVRTSVPATYPIKPWPWEEDIPPSAWVENVLEALDEPGEWVLNTQQGELYLWPQDEKPSDNIVAPKLRELIRVEGNVDKTGPVDVPVQYLTFRGLTFTHGDRDVWTKDDAGIQHDWEMYDKASALLRFRSTAHCLVDGCRFTNTGGTGLRFDLYSQYNRVQRSLFDYLGQAGIFVCGYGPGTKDVSFHNEIINNHIHHCGEIYKSGHGIIIWQSRDNRVANNLIHDGPRKAVLVAGVRAHFFDTSRIPKNNRECSKQIRWAEIGDPRGWDYTVGFLHVYNNIIEDNEAYRMCKIGNDGAVINITGNGEGNVIRRNYIHDIVNDGPDAVIRLDANGRGTLITENIIYRCAPQGIVLNDRNNHVENNIVVDTGKETDSDWQRYMVYYRGGPRPGRIQRNVLYFSDQRSQFFATRREVEPYPGDYNLYYSKGNLDAGRELLQQLQQKGTDRHSISADPMFVDLKNENFRLKDGSPMFELGFKQIDMSKIGLTDDFPENCKD